MDYDHHVAITTQDLYLLVILAFAGARITRIVMLDTIAAPLRDWVWGRFGVTSRAGILLACPWCVSWWVSVATVVFSLLFGLVSSVPVALLMIPAVAGATVWAGRCIEGNVDEDT